jgi:hypothetical protein
MRYYHYFQLGGPANAQFHFETFDVPGATSTIATGNSPDAIVGQCS